MIFLYNLLRDAEVRAGIDLADDPETALSMKSENNEPGS
jgi:hypothetical protein